MPFPLEKLPYGFRRRLRELATPAEASALQTAAPNYSGLQPIVKVRLINHVEINIDEESNLVLQRWHTLMSLPRDDVVLRILGRLHINNFTRSSHSQLILERFIFATNTVILKGCVINSPFVKSLVNRMEQKVLSLMLNNCTIPKRKIAHIICNADVFKSLSFLRLFRVKTSLNSWIDAFLHAKSCSLRYFTITVASPAALRINKNKFLKFFKAQRECFEMQIFTVVKTSEVGSKLKALFGSNFKCMFGSPKGKKHVRVAPNQYAKFDNRYYVLSYRKKKYVYEDDDVFYSLNSS